MFLGLDFWMFVVCILGLTILSSGKNKNEYLKMNIKNFGISRN